MELLEWVDRGARARTIAREVHDDARDVPVVDAAAVLQDVRVPDQDPAGQRIERQQRDGAERENEGGAAPAPVPPRRPVFGRHRREIATADAARNLRRAPGGSGESKRPLPFRPQKPPLVVEAHTYGSGPSPCFAWLRPPGRKPSRTLPDGAIRNRKVRINLSPASGSKECGTRRRSAL